MFVWKGRKNSEIQTPREETPPSFFSREKSCQLRPKATIERERRKKKSAPARKPSRERPSRPRLRTLPATNAREQNRIVQIRGPRSTFSLERWRQRDAKICGRREKDYFHSLPREERKKKTTKFALFSRVPFVAAAAAGGFAVVVDIFIFHARIKVLIKVVQDEWVGEIRAAF